jgi:DNA processing protein
MESLLRTGLFFAALPFRTELYRRGGWPSLVADEEPLQTYSRFLRDFYSKKELMAALRRADDYMERKSSEILRFQIILNSDERYPPLLKKIFDPPPVLFWEGPELYGPEVAYISVVGTRYPDRITMEAVDRFADCLIDASSISSLYRLCIEESFPQPVLFPYEKEVREEVDLVTVSGFAFGVDERIHRASIYRRIPTLAVLGSGLEMITPVANRYLLHEAEELNAELAFVSEFFPDDPPRKFAYPRRNRIIAGMSSLCIVFQAGARSGALITARFAIDEGRDVAAFDHPDLFASGKNEGARGLLAEGAGRLRLFVS